MLLYDIIAVLELKGGTTVFILSRMGDVFMSTFMGTSSLIRFFFRSFFSFFRRSFSAFLSNFRSALAVAA